MKERYDANETSDMIAGGQGTQSQGQRLTMEDVRDLALGATFLGAGGGGAPHTALLQIEALYDRGGDVSLIDLSELPDDGLVAPCGWLGAPTVSDEKLPNGREAIR
ncbi:MAG: DUF917 family protein, partial [Sphingomonadales bacterium]